MLIMLLVPTSSLLGLLFFLILSMVQGFVIVQAIDGLVGSPTF